MKDHSCHFCGGNFATRAALMLHRDLDCQVKAERAKREQCCDCGRPLAPADKNVDLITGLRRCTVPCHLPQLDRKFRKKI